MNPFFSIVIPTFNRAALVKEAVHSVIQQTFRDFEIIVVDDGSTDNTEAIIQKIDSYPLKYFKKLNGERGAARNFGIDKASGEYVVFLDSDDLMMPNHLEVLNNRLKENKENFIATKYFFFNDRKQFASNDILNLKNGYHTLQSFLIGNPLACCFTIRRENSALIKFREERELAIMEDWIFLVENLRQQQIYIIDQVTLLMRDHDERSMRSDAHKIVTARLHALSYLLRTHNFDVRDKKKLIGYTNYFCAVHSFIGQETSMGFRYLRKSIFEIGFSKNAIWLFIKLSFQWVWIKAKK